MAVNRVPEDGELQLAAVRLPPGRRIHAWLRSGGPVAWATTELVPDPLRVWAALSAAHRDTGLVLGQSPLDRAIADLVPLHEHMDSGGGGYQVNASYARDQRHSQHPGHHVHHLFGLGTTAI
jgi:hypothetical protein